MVAQKSNITVPTGSPQREPYWYAPDPRLRNKGLAEQAIQVVEWIQTGDGFDKPPGEEILFTSLHACAYRATSDGRKNKKPLPTRQRNLWARRWRIIREHIVESNIGLVYSMIGRFNSLNLDDDDQLSDALFGLARAVDKFNPWRGYRFSTYACNVIARSLMRRGKQVGNYRRLFPVQHDVSFERPERMPDTDTELYLERLRKALNHNLGDLTDLESRILSDRFPNDLSPRLTFKEIGDSIGLSKERVRQIQNIALGKLREVLDADPVLQ